jgi:hypothetical protein
MEGLTDHQWIFILLQEYPRVRMMQKNRMSEIFKSGSVKGLIGSFRKNLIGNNSFIHKYLTFVEGFGTACSSNIILSSNMNDFNI